jgi:hypothetical protein
MSTGQAFKRLHNSSVIGCHQLVAPCDPSKVRAQMVAQISNADLHWALLPFAVKSAWQLLPLSRLFWCITQSAVADHYDRSVEKTKATSDSTEPFICLDQPGRCRSVLPALGKASATVRVATPKRLIAESSEECDPPGSTLRG